jgi:hypothetical protein
MPVLKSGQNNGGFLSEYERQRAANIERNENLMASLGLHSSVYTPTASKKLSSSTSPLLVNSRPPRQPPRRWAARAATSPQPRQSARTKRAGRAAAGVAADAASTCRKTRPLVLRDSARAAGSSSDFAWRVLRVVNAIPVGKVSSYGQVRFLLLERENLCVCVCVFASM